jgi:hypothetical protein
MNEISVANWWNNLGTTIQPAFNSTAMLALGPSHVIFGGSSCIPQKSRRF